MCLTSHHLTDYKVLIFDVYGTLADWETGIYEALEPLLSRYPVSNDWSRKEALTAFGSVETDLQAQHSDMLYSDLLSKVHETLEERLKAISGQTTSTTLKGGKPADTSMSGTESSASNSTDNAVGRDDEHKAFGDSIKNWPIFKDTSAALHRLSRYFKLVVLSNVDRTSFRHTHLGLSEGHQSSSSGIAKSKLDLYTYPDPNPNRFWHPHETEGSRSPFTLILTAQDVGCYKPALGGFQTAFNYIAEHHELFGKISESGNSDEVKEKTLSVAQSLTHDHAPAAKLGMRSVWIDRQSAVTCNDDGGVKNWTWRFETLGEFADAVEKEYNDKNASTKD